MHFKLIRRHLILFRHIKVGGKVKKVNSAKHWRVKEIQIKEKDRAEGEERGGRGGGNKVDTPH